MWFSSFDKCNIVCNHSASIEHNPSNDHTVGLIQWIKINVNQSKLWPDELYHISKLSHHNRIKHCCTYDVCNKLSCLSCLSYTLSLLLDITTHNSLSLSCVWLKMLDNFYPLYIYCSFKYLQNSQTHIQLFFDGGRISEK